MLSDEPVLDVFLLGPSQIPDDVLDEVRAGVAELVSDPVAKQFMPRKAIKGWKPDAPGVVLEARAALGLLAGGAGGIRAGSRYRISSEIFGDFLANPRKPVRQAESWTTDTVWYRPPAYWLLSPGRWRDTGADAQTVQRNALELARVAVGIFEPLEILAPRRDALLALYDAHLDGGLSAADLTGSKADMAADWAATASDDVMAALPELAGPIGYLQWVWEGLEAAHGQLADRVTGVPELPKVVCQLLIQAKTRAVPAELALVAGQDLHDEVSARLGKEAADYSADAFSESTLSWLSRGLVADQIDACRIWLDMALRFIAAAKGLPKQAEDPLPCALPVAEFIRTVRQFSRSRSVTNTVAARIKEQNQAAGGAAAGQLRPVDPLNLIVGQPELTQVLRDAVAETSRPVRVHVIGPPGTYKTATVSVIEQALERRGLTREPVWITPAEIGAMDETGAQSLIRTRAAECDGRSLLVLSGLTDMVSALPGLTAALISVLTSHPDLQAIGISDRTGDADFTGVPPDLDTLFEVARTHDFDLTALSELFSRAIAQRGARADGAVIQAAAKLAESAQAPAERRNRFLIEYLADLSVARARSRGSDDGSVTVAAEDLPRSVNVDDGDPLREVNALIGMDAARPAITDLVTTMRAEQVRRDAGAISQPAERNMIFAGGPGTGKTLMAETVGRVLHRFGLLSSGHLVEATRADLIGQYTTDSVKLVAALTQKAAGGVLLVDDACALSKASSRDREALERLEEALNTCRGGDLVMIVAGPDPDITEWVKTVGWSDRFPTVVAFPGYSTAELAAIFAADARESGFILVDGVEERARSVLARIARGSGNARLARLLLRQTMTAQARRVMGATQRASHREALEIVPDDVPADVGVFHLDAPGDPLADLDALTGLADVKGRVRQLVAEAKAEAMRRKAGMPIASPTRHMVFSGNPGTAKTTVARLLAAIYQKLGLLSSGHLVEVSRVDLIGPYLGQTAPRVQQAVAKAKGGVLFIDEAYSLINSGYAHGDAYGQEAVDTLIKLMEDQRDDLVVIAAGYPDLMEEFLEANPGIKSRFPTVVDFPDYTDKELLQIFNGAARQAGFELADGVEKKVRAVLAVTGRGRDFGNGRTMRNILEGAVSHQAVRLTGRTSDDSPPSATDVRTITADDIVMPVKSIQKAFGFGASTSG
jgi:SpoVK/Ycf46/Vps4 family AAA+-type ATPase